MSKTPPEARNRLWALIPGPIIWAAHFLFSYAVGALWCANFVDPSVGTNPARIVIAVVTLVALALIALAARHSLRRERYGELAAPPHDDVAAASHHRFLGFASLLLNALAAIAILFTGLSVLFIRTCS